MNIQPKISLVGAGPGDPDLITMKGLRALRTADVVLYDALVAPELLREAPDGARRIYVGKRAADHAYTQEEINLLMVQSAFNFGHVVRLKGGDPFVFGRGHEELEYARAFDLEVQVVPGISSCYSLPELQSVPLTRRGLNESFWVLTGTTRNGHLSEDVALAAQSSATAVILMGLRKLEEICQLFSRHGKVDTAVMVIQNGSRPDEKMVLGTVNTIHQKVTEAGLGTPAIIIIGDVVGLHPRLNLVLKNAGEQPGQK